jgi:hypothetical protein
LATANNGLLVTSAAGIPSILVGSGVTGNMLQSQAAAPPAWSTSTWPATTTINRLLYSSAANTVADLATANSATLATTSAGVPIMVALGATQTLVGVSSSTPAAGNIPGQNMVINGDMQICQRGAGGAGSFAIAGGVGNTYTLDRWQERSLASASACTVTQAAGATSGSFLLRIQRTAAETGTGQIIIGTTLTRDMCVGAAGNAITLSFKAKCGANYSPTSSFLSVTVDSGTGSTDVSDITTGFTGASVLISNNATLTTTLTNFKTSTVAISASITQLSIIFKYNPTGTAGADDSFYITDVQLEISPVQSPYERRSFGDELALCQRFFCKSFLYGTAPAQSVGSTAGAIGYRAEIASTAAGYTLIAEFPTQMRIAPTVTYYNPSAANSKWRNVTGAADSGTATTDASITIGDKRVCVNNPQVAADAAGNAICVHYSADCDLT